MNNAGGGSEKQVAGKRQCYGPGIAGTETVVWNKTAKVVTAGKWKTKKKNPEPAGFVVAALEGASGATGIENQKPNAKGCRRVIQRRFLKAAARTQLQKQVHPACLFVVLVQVKRTAVVRQQARRKGVMSASRRGEETVVMHGGETQANAAGTKPATMRSSGNSRKVAR